MANLIGRPTDESPGILATGDTDINLLYISMSGRSPVGQDAEYIEWHMLDHQPEQHRINDLRASIRMVSSPACREARAASDRRYDEVDHVMSYLWKHSDEAFQRFTDLNSAKAMSGRTIEALPPIERAAFRVGGMAAAPRIKIGSSVLPFWPATGIYLLIEEAPPTAGNELVEAEGVGGAWWGPGWEMGAPETTAPMEGLHLTYCFLDGDPVVAAQALRPILEKRWAAGDVTPLLAAPFHTIVRYEWDRYLP